MDITVVGHARASVKPERATLHLVAGIESGDKGDALTRTTALVGKLQAHIQAMEGAGMSPITWYAVLPVQTRSFRPYSDKGAVLPQRHVAESVVKIKFRDFEALSQFATQVGGTAGVSLRYVEWALTEASRTHLAGQVLKMAVADAKSRATAIATAAGANGVSPLEIADPGLLSGVSGAGASGPRQVMSARAGGAGASGKSADEQGIDLAPEDVVITAEVHARYTTT
ncbi:MAG: SIMPL domain-containing protein [Austwickia sp.]|nr:SIMPL domain-containing protein [Actinomycetota bacterium]MCB1253577.1 SIMPL domain-containing protein [Austwickia sp.]MCO5310054.1 SIMPL domain-containing protein [Austwickia sp.]